MKQIEDYIIQKIPQILSNLNRNQYSNSFGSFDRDYWHYKIRDFSSLPLQQSIFVLLEIYLGNFKQLMYDNDLMLEYIKSSIEFLNNNYNKLTEYYNYEDSYAAAAFSLYSSCNTIKELNKIKIKVDPKIFCNYKKIASKIANKKMKDSSNQYAVGISSIFILNTFESLDNKIINLNYKHLDELLNSQSLEGYFPEHNGLDLGYLSVTLDALVDLSEIRLNNNFNSKVNKAIKKIIDCIHEYINESGNIPFIVNSRNTNYLLVYGLTKQAKKNHKAKYILNCILNNFSRSSNFYFSLDERYCLHYVFTSLVRGFKYFSNIKIRKKINKDIVFIKYNKDSGNYIYKNFKKKIFVYIAFNKGGSIMIDSKNKIKIENGFIVKKRNKYFSPYFFFRNKVNKFNNTFSFNFNFFKIKNNDSNSSKHFLLRLISFFAPNFFFKLIKYSLMFYEPQKRMICNKEIKLTYHKSDLKNIKVSLNIRNLNFSEYSFLSQNNYSPKYVASSNFYFNTKNIELSNLLDNKNNFIEFSHKVD